MGGILDVDVTNIYFRDVMIILTYIKTWLWCQDKFIYYRFMASEIVNVTKKISSWEVNVQHGNFNMGFLSFMAYFLAHNYGREHHVQLSINSV